MKLLDRNRNLFTRAIYVSIFGALGFGLPKAVSRPGIVRREALPVPVGDRSQTADGQRAQRPPRVIFFAADALGAYIASEVYDEGGAELCGIRSLSLRARICLAGTGERAEALPERRRRNSVGHGNRLSKLGGSGGRRLGSAAVGRVGGRPRGSWVGRLEASRGRSWETTEAQGVDIPPKRGVEEGRGHGTRLVACYMGGRAGESEKLL